MHELLLDPPELLDPLEQREPPELDPPELDLHDDPPPLDPPLDTGTGTGIGIPTGTGTLTGTGIGTGCELPPLDPPELIPVLPELIPLPPELIPLLAHPHELLLIVIGVPQPH